MAANQMFLDPESINYDTFPPDFRSIPNGKLVIFGLPKCGNTWVQSLLCSYFDVEPVLTIDEIEFSGVLSVHDPFVSDFVGREDLVNGICLIRDVRDLIVSYYHYANTEQWRAAMTRNYYPDFDSFYFEWFLSRCVPAHRFHTFANEFSERGIPVVRYERLSSNPETEFARLLKRLGYEVDYQRLKRCIEEHMLERLKTSGLYIRYRVETTHFRKGGWGNFLEEMPDYILADVNARFSDYLRRWGYPMDLDEKGIAAFKDRLRGLSECEA